MESPTRFSFFKLILWDTIGVLGFSLWIWMMMDALKPGIVSYYWNIQYHWIVLMVCVVVAFVLDAEESSGGVRGNSPSVYLLIAYALAAGMTIALVLAPWGAAAIALGLLTIVMTSSLYYSYTYDEVHEQ